MSFTRRIKKKSGTYLALVQSYRKNGKVKQKVIRYLGKEIDGKPVKRVLTSNIGAEAVKRYGDVLAVDKLARELGLHKLLGGYAKETLLLTYSHLLDTLSIRKIETWLKDTELPEILAISRVSTKQLYETLAHISSMQFREVEEGIYCKFKKYDKGDRTLVIDVTDTYFEGNSSSSKKRRGKDGKYKKLLQICLAVTLEHGFPITHKVYGGNISTIKIFVDMAAELRLRGFDAIIIDRGMYSATNIGILESLKLKGIVGVKKTPGLVDRFLKGIEREGIYSRDNRIVLKSTKVYALSFPFREGTLIVVYNPLREVHRREIHYEKGGSDEDARYLGYTLLYHNTGLGTKDVVKRYFEKDIIERAFKQVKGILSLRPIRVWLREHVEGHVRVCYLAYALLSLFSYKIRGLEIGTIDALDKLKTCYRVHLRDKESGFSWNSTVALENIQERILRRVGVVYKS